jgi:hypothetical protein
MNRLGRKVLFTGPHSPNRQPASGPSRASFRLPDGRHNQTSLLSRRGETYNAGAMRIVVGCMLVVAGSVVLTQSSQDLHSRYGEPDRERFSARPGISLTVEYGSDHLACNARLSLPQPLTYTEENVRLMSSEGVSEVLEEVAPVAMRALPQCSRLSVAVPWDFEGKPRAPDRWNEVGYPPQQTDDPPGWQVLLRNARFRHVRQTGSRREGEEAVAAADRAVKSIQNPIILAQVASAYALAGKHGKARTMLSSIEAKAEERYICGFNVACVYVFTQP